MATMNKIIAQAVGSFPFQFYIEKAEAKDEDGEMVVEGIASTVNVDHDNERMSTDALKSMVNIINEKSVPLRVEHEQTDNAIVGSVYKAWIDARNQMWIKAKLDKSRPFSSILHNSLKSGAKLGLSVGGRVKHAMRELSEGVGKMVKTFYDIDLNEVSVTTKPSNYDAWLLNKHFIENKEDAVEFYDLPSFKNAFLFENPHMDYLQVIAKSIPDGAWENTSNKNIDMGIFHKESTETTEDTKEKEMADSTTETKKEQSSTETETEKEQTETESDKTNKQAEGETTTETETTKSVSRKEFEVLKSTVDSGFKAILAALQKDSRDGQETTEGDGTTDVESRYEKEESTSETESTKKETDGDKTDSTETEKEETDGTSEKDEYGTDYKMDSTESTIKRIKSISDGVKKSFNKEADIDVLAKSVAKTFDAVVDELERHGKELVGVKSLMLSAIHGDQELQKSIKEMISQPGIKKSVSMGNAYFQTRDGKLFQLNATELKQDVSKSAGGKRDFKSIYKSEFSSSATGETLSE